MNDNPSEKFADLTEHLKKELNLIDSDELNRMKKHKAQMQENFKKGIEEIALDEEDHHIIREIVDNLPESFFMEFGFDKDTLMNDNWMYLEKEHPEAFKKFLKKLTEHEIATDVGNIKVSSNEPKPLRENEPIETLLKIFYQGNEKEREDACIQLEKRFYAQMHDCQVFIMKALLTADSFTRRICYRKLLPEWWDDAIIPDVERNWQNFREPDCLRVIAHRFPLDYVLSHEFEIGEVGYLSLCLRLASDNDFIIDKCRLSRKEYCRIIACNHLHLDQTEAEDLLFGHVLHYLTNGYQPSKYYTQYWDEDVYYPIGQFYDNYEYFLSLLLNHKPSLTFLPGMKYLIWTLGNTGNTSTIMKFLLWNKRLQLNIPGFLSKEYNQADTIQLLKSNFKTYLDWSWEQLLNLAEETFPIDKSIITNEFRDVDDFSVIYLKDYAPF